MTERTTEIVQAARSLIIENDGKIPTVRQIAARSFLSPAAIYVHFENVEVILDEVRQDAITEVLRVAISSGACRDEVFGAIARWAMDNLALVTAFSGSGVLHQRVVDSVLAFVNSSFGRHDMSPTVIRVAIRMAASVPLLVRDLNFDEIQVRDFLLSLVEPIQSLQKGSAPSYETVLSSTNNA
ncbi:MAG: hypothetical protein V3V01_06955 [Acidimicrobiales bacterium]